MNWIIKYVTRRRVIRRRVSLKGRVKEYKEYKEKARALATSRLLHFNSFYGFAYGRIAIRNTKSRWGSCSAKGNLNFTYRIALIPPDLADYIIVHELCHIGEFNHAKAFWDLVAQTIPDWKEKREALKKINLAVSKPIR
jgi:predicted metal-dependent hydrolase